MRVAEVKALLQQLGASPRKSLGQNFLVNKAVVDRILARVHETQAHDLIEVGPGLGSLTWGLIGTGKSLSLIERDRCFAAYWREQKIAVLEEDALAVDWSAFAQRPTLVVSNLPYQISSSLVIDRSIGPAWIESMILMFQKEVAQRIVARVATADYSLLSVIAQVFWDIQGICDAGPGDFYPSPKVASRVLAFSRSARGSQFLAAGEAKEFVRFVKAAFSQRRKLLVRNLEREYGLARRPWIEQMAALKLDPRVRAEHVSPQDYVHCFSAATKTE